MEKHFASSVEGFRPQGWRKPVLVRKPRVAIIPTTLEPAHCCAACSAGPRRPDAMLVLPRACVRQGVRYGNRPFDPQARR